MQLVEIIPTDIRRQVLAPVIRDPLIDDGTAQHEFLQPVSAVAERRLQRSGRNVAFFAGFVDAFVPVLGQHTDLTDDLRQFAITRSIEGESYLTLAGLFDLRHMLIIGGKLRAVLFECIEREDHVFGRHRHAVVKLRLRPQAIGDRGEIVGMADAFGEQAIFGRHLI
jgi:hypothetical protein